MRSQSSRRCFPHRSRPRRRGLRTQVAPRHPIRPAQRARRRLRRRCRPHPPLRRRAPEARRPSPTRPRYPTSLRSSSAPAPTQAGFRRDRRRWRWQPGLVRLLDGRLDDDDQGSGQEHGPWPEASGDRRPRTPIRAPCGARAGTRSTSRAEAMAEGSAARSGHANAKLSPLGGPPGFGNQLPSRNPSVSLLRDTGGAAGLSLAGMLAVLGAAVALRRDRSRIFRMPTVTWRPLAYVPPIELPG